MRTSSTDNITLQAKTTGGSFATVATLPGTDGDWVTYPFTADIPNTAVDLALTLNSSVAVDIELDSFIVALVSNPTIQKQEQVRKIVTIAAGATLTVTSALSITCQFSPNDSIADITIAGQSSASVTITNNDGVSRQGLLITKPSFGY
jgi:hypothetical protein